MRYTNENCSGISSEIAFMDEIKVNETIDNEDALQEEKPGGNPSKGKKGKNNNSKPAVSSKEAFIVNLKLSDKIHQRIKILCDLEGISCVQFYSEAINDKLKELSKKHCDIEKLKSIILGE